MGLKFTTKARCGYGSAGDMMDGVIKTKIFLDKDGHRTCAVNFETGEVCEFLRTQRFGTHETCVFAPQNGKLLETLERRGPSANNIAGNPNVGSLIPASWCPIEDA